LSLEFGVLGFASTAEPVTKLEFGPYQSESIARYLILRLNLGI